jgi:2,3-diketo-5-methylthiopentyl-1-phosphate enolase
MGATAGARALRQGIDAVMEGRPLRDAAREHQELRVALDLWGVYGEKDLFEIK